MVERVLASGRYILGEEVERFERAFAAFCGARHVVGVASGTDAISIALAAGGVRPGDEVVTAANTCVPTVVGIEGCGAVPVLADVDPATFTLTPETVERALSGRTRAILPVHLYGQCADMAALTDLAAAHRLLLFEDCAQAVGAEVDGRLAGGAPLTAAFSFYPTKNLGAAGDAGAITTDDAAVAEQARLARNYGEVDTRFHHVIRGRNSRLDPLQAAILRAKLRHVGSWTERRREIAGRYTRALRGSPVEPPVEAEGRGHVYHLYVVRAAARDRFRAALAERGVESAVHYPLPIHHQPAYRDLAPEGRSLEVSEWLAETVVSLPLHPELSDAEVEHVALSAAAASRA